MNGSRSLTWPTTATLRPLRSSARNSGNRSSESVFELRLNRVSPATWRLVIDWAKTLTPWIIMSRPTSV